MSDPEYPIPSRLNLALCGGTLVVLVSLLGLAGRVGGGWPLVALAMAYGIAMNTGYALIHEAEHGILHPDPRINDGCGVVLALFFPAPFHLLRQGHLGHHLRNRSDDEAFDFYVPGESALWRWLQLYGTLLGLFWVAIVLGNLIAAVSPGLLRRPATPFDRSADALRQSLNPRYDGHIRLEAWALLMLHGVLMHLFQVPPSHYGVVLFGFGFSWSAMQYVHHFGTVRDVAYGARNLKTFGWLDRVWLNHNWHLNHHLCPTVPWIHLPNLFRDPGFQAREGLLRAYLRMWRGPRFSAERIENRFAGKIIP